MANSVRLGDFILSNMASILKEWEQFADTINPPALIMDSQELRDHAELMLTTIAFDLGTHQSSFEQKQKSKGLSPHNLRVTAAQFHAEGRLKAGFTIGQLLSEYRALRASVLNLWDQSIGDGLFTDARDVTRFNEAIDQAIAESVERFCELLRKSENIFLAILGHDLRNPLSTCIASTSMILSYEKLDNRIKSNASRTYTSLQRMNELITDLMEYTGSHLGKKLSTIKEPANMANICNDIIDEHQIAHPTRQIIKEINGSFDGQWDKQRIGQVISNLLGNAIDYGDKVTPIKVNLDSSMEGITIRINNQGKPIPESTIMHIFEPLTRHQESGSGNCPQKSNLGLGLYIANEIINAHDGSIRVTSNEKDGTTFEVKVPY